MSSYISNLLTTTTSRYNSLRRNLLDGEGDGDTEDDSHISRVLRAYYIEKGRPFPPWLPPDPKTPQQAPTQFVSSLGRQPGQQQQPQMGRGSGLSGLWDEPQQQPPPQQEPQSLRRAQGRGGGGRGMPGRPSAVEQYSEPQVAPRPLPSQRAGSYQPASSFGRPPAEPSPPPSSGSGATAQERLKARLWGSGRNSPLQSASANSSPATTPGAGSAGMRNPYERSNSGGSARQAAPAPYQDNRGGYGGGRGNQSQSAYTSANSPWSNPADDEFGGGAYDTGRQYGGPGGGGRERIGLPNGPRPR